MSQARSGDNGFEEFWAAYPERAPKSNAKQAEKAWIARMKQGADPQEIITGARNYAEHCRRKDKIGTEFVKMAVTFLGPAEHWKQFQETVEGKPSPGRVNRTADEYNDLLDWEK